MAKFNQRGVRPAAHSPVRAEQAPSARTHEGGPGHARDAKSELFLLAVANMVGEKTFYENAGDRDDRFRTLVHQVAVQDGPWMAAFLPWLRGEANMRSAPVVAALEAVHARLAAGLNGGNRQLVASVLQRADEPGEALAYWTSTYGRAIPQPVKRGVADAVRRLYNERSLLKYDTDARGWRFGDVIDMVHPVPDPAKPRQGDLFKYAIDHRHNRPIEVDDVAGVLPMIHDRHTLRWLVLHGGKPEALLDPDNLSNAGMTWEEALSIAGDKVNKAKLWEALAPSMGYMALLRNLRNFDEAGVSDEVADLVAAKLADPQQVTRSRQFPFRFYSAYLAAPSLRWGHALDKALTLATRNVPAFNGRTLVLVDTSASMTSGGVSERSKMNYAQMAALFGVALAARGNAVDLHGFADNTFRHQVGKGASVLKEVERFCSQIGRVGHGTRIAEAVRATYNGHDRVIILSDMQTFTSGWGVGNVTDAAPKHVPMYGFNLAGYKHAAMPSGTGTRHELGGMSDATFRMIPLLEAGRNCDWPFMEQAAA